MSSTWGTNIELSIFGESHGEAIGIVIGNLPAGIELNFEDIELNMARRAPGGHLLTTPRKESDQVKIVSGLLDGKTTGAPLCAMIENKNHRSSDYDILKECMRPGHADYSAYIKYNGFNDARGGGHFSGRLTAPIVFAGSIAKQILKQKGIYVGSHILSIKDEYDEHFGVHISKELLDSLKDVPTLNKDTYLKMQNKIKEALEQGDSLGGKIECALINVPAGLGAPFFDSLESHISSLMFAIPSIKSISFGLSDDITLLLGSEANDSYYYEGDDVKTSSNNNGGILGGISNGMPVVFTVGIKPTSSISKIQNTVNVKTKENVSLELQGRHDPCIVLRALVVVESMAALALLDMMGY